MAGPADDDQPESETCKAGNNATLQPKPTRDSVPSVAPNEDVNWFESGLVHVQCQLGLIANDVEATQKCTEDLEKLLDTGKKSDVGHAYCDHDGKKCNTDHEKRNVVEMIFKRLSRRCGEMVVKLSNISTTYETVLKKEQEIEDAWWRKKMERAVPGKD